MAKIAFSKLSAVKHLFIVFRFVVQWFCPLLSPISGFFNVRKVYRYANGDSTLSVFAEVNDTLHYAWTKSSGPGNVTLSSNASDTTLASFTAPGLYTLMVTVSDTIDSNAGWIVSDRIYKAASPSQYKGQWNHYAFTKNTTAGTMRVYINGVEFMSGTGKTIEIGAISQFVIGSHINGGWPYLGTIDDFRVYNAELSAAESSALANQ
ncbi:hypothetical protein BVY04_01785 [bacterium M21]|nr:hypothetical protein BVY04_01785 [bacterium M21]